MQGKNQQQTQPTGHWACIKPVTHNLHLRQTVFVDLPLSPTCPKMKRGMPDSWTIISKVLPDRGLSFTLAKGGGEATGVDGFEEYEPPLSVG